MYSTMYILFFPADASSIFISRLHMYIHNYIYISATGSTPAVDPRETEEGGEKHEISHVRPSTHPTSPCNQK